MASRVILSAIGDLEISNDATEQTLFSGTVPGGTLGTSSLIVLRMLADQLNVSGVGQTFTIRVKYGGTTIHTFTSVSQNSNPDRRADFTTVFLGASNATNSQRSYMEHKQGGTNSAAGAFGNGNDHNNSVNSGIAVDSTADQTLAVTIQLSAADANLKFRRRGVWVEHYDPVQQGSGNELVLLDQKAFSYNNNSTETSVVTVTIPAGTIRTGNLVIVRIFTDVLNNSGIGTVEWFHRVYWAGVQIFNGQPGVANASSATLYSFNTELWLGGHTATNDQVVGMLGQQLSSNTSAGEGTLTSGGQANNSTNVSTIDTTVDTTLEFRNIFNTANSSVQYNYRGMMVAVLK